MLGGIQMEGQDSKKKGIKEKSLLEGGGGGSFGGEKKNQKKEKVYSALLGVILRPYMQEIDLQINPRRAIFLIIYLY